MTITREPAHVPARMRPRVVWRAPAPPRVDVYRPRRDVRVDQTFWQHRSIFAGNQEQLDRLRAEADARAAERARRERAVAVAERRAETQRRLLQAHRPAHRRLTFVVHVRLFLLLWNITTCRCGDRWPCNAIKVHIRTTWGWNIDFDQQLAVLTRWLPKPATRLTRAWRFLTSRCPRHRPNSEVSTHCRQGCASWPVGPDSDDTGYSLATWNP